MRRSYARLTGQQLHTELRSPSALVVVLVTLLLQTYAMMPVVQLCDSAGVNMTPFATVFVFNDIYYTFLSTVMSLGMVALCAGAPFLSQYQVQVLLRTGRKRWLRGQLVYMLILSVLYTAFWALSPLLCAFGRIEWSGQWGKIWTTLSLTNASQELRSMLDTPYEIVGQYAPMQALALSLSLRFIYIFLLAQVVFLGNLLSRSCAGVVAGIALSLMDYAVTLYGKNALLFCSPLTLTRLSMLDARNIWINPTPAQAFVILGTITLALAGYILLLGKRHVDV